MLIFENNKLTYSIYKKYLALLISKDFADKLSGKISLNNAQDSEQVNRRRELLAVEEETNKNKIKEAHGKNHFNKQVMDEFYTKLNDKMDKQLKDKEKLYHNILGNDNAVPDTLELLSVKAASIKRIAPIIQLLPWLSAELVALVNKPQYRKRSDVQVTDPNLAISYVGLDNLKQVMPTYILKHLLPNTTGSFRLLKRKLWNDSLAIGLASVVLAKEEGLDEFTAFTTGMFSNIGRLVVTSNYLESFNDLHRRELENSYDKKDKNRHEALIEIEKSPELLLEQLSSRSDKVTADIIEAMGFDRLPITKPIWDLAHINDHKKMSPMAQVIAKAKAYVTLRALAKDELISKEEVKILMATVKLSTNCFSLLKKSDIDHIKLKFN